MTLKNLPRNFVPLVIAVALVLGLAPCGAQSLSPGNKTSATASKAAAGSPSAPAQATKNTESHHHGWVIAALIGVGAVVTVLLVKHWNRKQCPNGCAPPPAP